MTFTLAESGSLNIAQSLYAAPYPGLRPFRREESGIFFGRSQQSDQLLLKLQKSRFLAVVGPSGCGKSSLVRAGMMAGLEAGFMVNAGSRWLFAEMRPGERPIGRLADALLSDKALGPQRAGESDAAQLVRATLRQGPLGLLEVLHETPLPENTNLLLIVDQFEEIFRFRGTDDVNEAEAEAFVSLLLATIGQKDIPVYIVLTMRSDFIGECALFPGLPEAMNESQFLTPRMTREQYYSAIIGPARVFNGEVDAKLVNQLVNDMGADPDLLPLLQHALMYMWTLHIDPTSDSVNVSTSAKSPEEAIHDSIQLKKETRRILTLDHYRKFDKEIDKESVGLAAALSKHANAIFDNELSEEQQAIAKIIFQRLTERSTSKRDTRHPARVGDIAAVAQVTPDKVIDVANVFRQSQRSFIMPPPEIPLDTETKLDIGHESLIRYWERLNKWADQEASSSAIYNRLKDASEQHSTRQGDLLSDIGIQRALKWLDEEKPNQSWASRYGTVGEFTRTIKFIKKSEALWTEKRQQHNFNRRFVFLSLLALLIGIISVFVSITQVRANRATQNANRAIIRANDATKYALDKEKEATKSATDEWQRAERLRTIAVKQTALATKQKEIARKALEEAKREKRRAEAEKQKAQNLTTIAEARRKDAIWQKNIATKKTAEALKQTKLAKIQADKASANEAKAIEAANQSKINLQRAISQKNAALRIAASYENFVRSDGATKVAKPSTSYKSYSWKLWPNGKTLKVRFLDGTPAIQTQVEKIAQEWTKYANLSLTFDSSSDSDIRISFKGLGAWSYIGTDALIIPKDQPTMNLGVTSGSYTQEEITQAVLREFGHALGLVNETANPNTNLRWNTEVAYKYFEKRGFSKSYVDRSYLQRTDPNSLPGYRKFDPKSVMLTPLPPELFLGKFEISINSTLSDSDKSFISKLYPGKVVPPAQ